MSKKSFGDHFFLQVVKRCFFLRLLKAKHKLHTSYNCPFLHTAHTGLIDSLCHQKKCARWVAIRGMGGSAAACFPSLSVYPHLLSSPDRGITSLLQRVKLHLYALVIREAVIKLIHLTCWIFHTYMLYCFGVSDPLSQISNGAAQTRRKGSTPLDEVQWMFVREITLF